MQEVWHFRDRVLPERKPAKQRGGDGVGMGAAWRSGPNTEAIVESSGDRGQKRDPLGDLEARIDRAIEEVRPKVKRALEELDSRVDAAVKELRPRVESAMDDVKPKVDRFVADIQPRLDAALERIQARIAELRRDLEERADRETQPPTALPPTGGPEGGEPGGPPAA